jgi:hypothetical protein
MLNRDHPERPQLRYRGDDDMADEARKQARALEDAESAERPVKKLQAEPAGDAVMEREAQPQYPPRSRGRKIMPRQDKDNVTYVPPIGIQRERNVRAAAAKANLALGNMKRSDF